MTKELVREGKLDRAAHCGRPAGFLQNMLRVGGLELKDTVRAAEPSAGGEEGEAEVFADLDGKDKEILLARGGEVLRLWSIWRFGRCGLSRRFTEKIHLDCAGFRALRFEELRMTARVAAERVQSSRQPFSIEPHVVPRAADRSFGFEGFSGVRTESIGIGEERQV